MSHLDGSSAAPKFAVLAGGSRTDVAAGTSVETGNQSQGRSENGFTLREPPHPKDSGIHAFHFCAVVRSPFNLKNSAQSIIRWASAVVGLSQNGNIAM